MKLPLAGGPKNGWIEFDFGHVRQDEIAGGETDRGAQSAGLRGQMLRICESPMKGNRARDLKVFQICAGSGDQPQQ
jgi:hypothetical protein